MSAISSTAARNDASFAFDGLLKPLIFLTNWSDAARISSSVTGGSKLNNGRMFRHIAISTRRQAAYLDHRTDLDGPSAGHGDPGGDGDRLVQVGGLDHEEAPELLP